MISKIVITMITISLLTEMKKTIRYIRMNGLMNAMESIKTLKTQPKMILTKKQQQRHIPGVVT